MPVVELSYSNMRKKIGISKKKISETLPFLGLDIESEYGDLVKIEYSPNRPDYSTIHGVVLGLQGLLGIKTGLVNLKISQGDHSIMATNKVTKVRPCITGIIARGKVTDIIIKQLMTMQEDLHLGIGRRRKKSSIGIHDIDKITFPLTYTTAKRDHKFIPLNENKEFTIHQILKDTEYKSLVESSNVPIILDAKNNTVSFPPIINAADTTVTSKTKGLFIEVTGTSKKVIEDTLSIIALTLQTAGFSLERVNVSGAKNSTPKLKSREMTLNVNIVNDSLGLNLSSVDVLSCLKKSRLDGVIKDNTITCTIPSYRFDILGEMDLVEEVALGYGIYNLEPKLSPSQTLGKSDRLYKQLKIIESLMIGLGYTEALNSTLTSKRILFDETISVLDSKSSEHTVLRNLILPQLVENLSRNIHESYPQRLFETGTVFETTNETIHLAGISAHKDANYAEIKSIIHAISNEFNVTIETKASDIPMFKKGRAATIIAKKPIGIIGEINSDKIRVPLIGFELDVFGLILNSTNN